MPDREEARDQTSRERTYQLKREELLLRGKRERKREHNEEKRKKKEEEGNATNKSTSYSGVSAGYWQCSRTALRATESLDAPLLTPNLVREDTDPGNVERGEKRKPTGAILGLGVVHARLRKKDVA